MGWVYFGIVVVVVVMAALVAVPYIMNRLRSEDVMVTGLVLVCRDLCYSLADTTYTRSFCLIQEASTGKKLLVLIPGTPSGPRFDVREGDKVAISGRRMQSRISRGSAIAKRMVAESDFHPEPSGTGIKKTVFVLAKSVSVSGLGEHWSRSGAPSMRK